MSLTSQPHSNHSHLLDRPCSICGLSQGRLKYKANLTQQASVQEYVCTAANYSQYHDIYTCENCHMVYMSPIDSNLDALLSAVEDTDYLNSAEERLLQFKDFIQKMKVKKSQGHVLDIGCYAGLFMKLAEDNGFTTLGIEPSQWAADYAIKKFKLNVFNGSAESFKFSDKQFDIVCLWDSIEHLKDPQNILQMAHKTLKENGYLFITTHNINSLFAKLMGPKYPWLMRFHFHHYSQDTIRLALQKAGFQNIEVSGYKKVFTIKYFADRIGLKHLPKWLEQIKLKVSLGDMMFVSAEKTDEKN